MPINKNPLIYIVFYVLFDYYFVRLEGFKKSPKFFLINFRFVCLVNFTYDCSEMIR